ncbi:MULTISPECIES: sodium-extruding oxaloacetate decarboxylase subunit alpha [unclassified Oceanobacter]|jgi:oxaloacetate decarboxylase alpha subunit|uniref:sodium-extruding oxaloacetate decarboxylase subunit alpha n=2 Tax=Gammaproteobacteria TaxID=1236 RepID=UPI0026E189C9|nr:MULTISPECIES: sodium-extruding oxaloacetate decarboxylase subunit alpha [unclassified Oceanobacter]MDO6683731.1 sodium-extruding oxaloacetate decarboxylase subunit alpha [Oceanobacter sp. 5_MG-2023]MDP2546503.1 sodium-extruding oxaloacetate decarboxylase subunit alpha [Oceanobacter sp. 4_MG-2023]MDP2609833.1 sodium-extruding oxaloacetate decarboxylase subunit alpha [Oceanobacter sp. 1_MG-2023]MDP2613163.1 sodium-extruding oxaloacetate decarboxylase subunit alpha [Oceanobacter sp. 2_MG-2023]
MTDSKKLGITDVVLRDAHQSILATRMRIDDMLPIAEKLDQVGYWSLESWGGATFDSCIRFLGEDPWDRIREFKKAMPKTPHQMLLRGQNLLGYRHYADDVVEKFVERAATNGVDVFRVFDAMNDPRNLETALKAVKKQGKHAQGTLSYTTSPVHTMESWVSLAKQIEDMGADSIAIKDMAGVLTPYTAFELVSKLKAQTDLEVQLHAHATSGLSDMTILKAVEAGIDRVDTAISSMSMTYGHTATESVVAALAGTERDTGIDLLLLEEIAAYFRAVRKKYARFEGALKGTDSRILVAQVPGGMLTNMENQLREQGAADKFDEVLAEIPRVREDLGFIPLVTPTSQIVGTQAVLNVLTGERYKSISKETQGILKGEYGAAPAPMNAELQAKVLDGKEVITCRPADLIENEMDKVIANVDKLAADKGITLAADKIDDALTYAMFPQIAPKFLENRGNPDAFEPVPKGDAEDTFTISVDGNDYVVKVDDGGDVTHLAAVNGAPLSMGGAASTAGEVAASGDGDPVCAPLSGNVWKVLVDTGDQVEEGDVVVILEAMKMETEVRAPRAGTVTGVSAKEGVSVKVGDTLYNLA